MQTDINVNISFIHSFEFLNSTINISSTLYEERFEWTREEIVRWIHIIVRPILIVIGSIGNCLSFYIMRRTSLKDVSSCFYMSLLAVADTSKQILIFFHFGILSRWLPKVTSVHLCFKFFEFNNVWVNFTSCGFNLALCRHASHKLLKKAPKIWGYKTVR